MKKTLIFITCIFLFSFSQKTNSDSIVGNFYSSIYSSNDFKNDLILKCKIPKSFDSVYKKENDVGWKFEFHKNGEIKITDLTKYYSGFERILLKSGTWKKLNEKVYEITFNGESFEKSISKKNRYTIIHLASGDKKLILEK